MFNDLPTIQPESDDVMHLNSDAPSAQCQREAAVLIPLVWRNDEWHILFIRRAKNQHDRHSGQVAFPGGRLEKSDASAEMGALRETHEEIGVHPDQVQLLGTINPYVTISQYRVTPVVGIVNWPTTLVLQESEVARAFLIPLSWVKERDNFTYRARRELDAQSAKRHPIIVFNEYDGETLWGATARMTLNFIKSVEDNDLLLPAR